MFLLEVKRQTMVKIWQDMTSFEKASKPKDFFSFVYMYEIKFKQFPLHFSEIHIIKI